MELNTKSSAFNEGLLAFKAGYSNTFNPYIKNVNNRNEWVLGWQYGLNNSWNTVEFYQLEIGNYRNGCTKVKSTVNVDKSDALWLLSIIQKGLENDKGINGFINVMGATDRKVITSQSEIKSNQELPQPYFRLA